MKILALSLEQGIFSSAEESEKTDQNLTNPPPTKVGRSRHLILHLGGTTAREHAAVHTTTQDSTGEQKGTGAHLTHVHPLFDTLENPEKNTEQGTRTEIRAEALNNVPRQAVDRNLPPLPLHTSQVKVTRKGRVHYSNLPTCRRNKNLKIGKNCIRLFVIQYL
jgi:hypothetical protein